eukprot:1512297-Pleurochrysis_carterae.AAC.1
MEASPRALVEAGSLGRPAFRHVRALVVDRCAAARAEFARSCAKVHQNYMSVSGSMYPHCATDAQGSRQWCDSKHS